MAYWSVDSSTIWRQNCSFIEGFYVLGRMNLAFKVGTLVPCFRSSDTLDQIGSNSKEINQGFRIFKASIKIDVANTPLVPLRSLDHRYMFKSSCASIQWLAFEIDHCRIET